MNLIPRPLVWIFALVALMAASFLRAAPSLDELERTITDAQVVSLVQTTAEHLSGDAAGTIAAINQGQAPYKDASNPALYVFIYNPEVVMVAHPRPELVGKSVKGKPDVRGKKFRDEIVSRALTAGSGWVEYHYQKPNESGIHRKTTHFAKVTGSDGQIYIVCAGKYLTAAATP